MHKSSHFIRATTSVICATPNIAVSNARTKEEPIFRGLHHHTDQLLAIYLSSPFQNDRRNGIRTWYTLHQRLLNSTKFLMLKERQLSVLWTQQGKWPFSFQWLKIWKLLTVQFTSLFNYAISCWSDTGYVSCSCSWMAFHYLN